MVWSPLGNLLKVQVPVTGGFDSVSVMCSSGTHNFCLFVYLGVYELFVLYWGIAD